MTTPTNNKNPTDEVKWNVLDRAIEVLFPKRAYERLRWRMGISGYDASKLGRGSAGWAPVNMQGEMINRQARKILRARARDMERNNDVVNGILLAYKRNVVGKGFNLQALTDSDDINNAIESLWREWNKARNCDITGQQTLREILNMVMRRQVIDGEIAIIKTYDSNKKIPFQLQLREADDLDSLGLLNNQTNGNVICEGIEMDSSNRPIAYYFTETDANGMIKNQATRIEEKRVIYLWQRARPSEYRGITMLAPLIERLHNLDDYHKAVNFMQKILASICVFIKQALPDGISGALGRAKSIIPSEDPNDRQQKVKAGQIMYLKPGEEVSTLIPSGQAAEAAGYTTTQQRMSAAAIGLSLEATARDVSQVNYSSARQNLLEDTKTYNDWQQWLIDHLLDEIYTEFLISAYLAGQLPPIPDFWQNKEKYFKHRFIGQGMSWIDPVKESVANKTALETGQATLEEICAKAGKDWKEVLQQRAREKAYAESLGLFAEGSNTNANKGTNGTSPQTE